jgi:glutathione S-transferase
MELYGTAPSPFTRKVRVILNELGLSHDFRLITELLSSRPQDFADNPLLLLPSLHDQGRKIIDSSIIAQYLIETYGSEKSSLSYFPNGGDKFADLKRLALINGGMDAGVKIIRARRSEIPDFEKYPMFQQEETALKAALDWINQDLPGNAYYAGTFSTLEVTLQCFLDWALFRNLVTSLDAWPQLKAFNVYHQGRPSFFKTHPVHGA